MKKIYALVLAGLLSANAFAQESYEPGTHDNIVTVVANDSETDLEEYPLEVTLSNPTTAIAGVSAYFYIDDNSSAPWVCEEEDGEVFYIIETNSNRCSRNSAFDAFMTEPTNEAFPHYLFVNIYEKKSDFKLTEGTIATLYIDATQLSDGSHTIHVVEPMCSAASADGSSSASYYCPNQEICFSKNGGTLTIINGIDDLLRKEIEQQTFDLQGRPTTATQHGVYISRGKKVIK